MSAGPMTSLDRIRTVLTYREPDRVPFFLALTTHGAKELGLSLRDYYSSPRNVAEGQLRMWRKYQDDAVTNFFYAGVEHEAFGGEVLFFDDGSANAGAPVLRTASQIDDLVPPRIGDCPGLIAVLDTTTLLRGMVGDLVALLGMVVSPFSLPIMQLGFEDYLQLLHEQPAAVARLMAVNVEFCVRWANAQLDAGADAIGYFDPVSSPTIIPHDLFLRTGLPVARETIRRIAGPTGAFFGSGRSLPIVDDVAGIGAAMISAASEEDLAEVKAAAGGRLAVVGNLNAVQMRRWSGGEAEAEVKRAIARAGPGGGFILSDAHGEIPWQVSEQVLLDISAAVRRWGRYPLEWTRDGDPG
jgi:uroporphyrinogen decarboxylase